MYYAAIILLMLVFPAASVATAHWGLHSTETLLALTGKWFVIWGMGARLGLAGLRQVVKPAFTAETIFGLTDTAAQHIVQELGFGNLALGVLGLSCLLFPWVLPSSVAGAIFYALAGIKHVTHSPRTVQQNWAMVSDIFMAVVLAGFAASTLGGFHV